MEEIKKLVEKLNKYQKSYNAGHPEISDKEWDDLYNKLKEMEIESGYFLPDSPTQRVYDFSPITTLEKTAHSHPMLSLEKTKNIEVLDEFCQKYPVCLMAKMDGLTCSLEYNNGELIKAETRGNGLVGENILPNVLASAFVPKKIEYKYNLVIDGEIICKYSDFDPYREDFRNPRNFAAGSIRLQNPKECRNRPLTFVAWEVVSGYTEFTLLSERLEAIRKLGFVIVPYEVMDKTDGSWDDRVDRIKQKCTDYPIDGLVAKYNKISLKSTLGETAHHFKNALAYKFYDEEYETTLKAIDWSMGTTGTLTPVAIFDEVNIKDTVISRASLFNLDVLEETLGVTPYVGQKVYVIKCNEVIPQINWSEIQTNPDNPIPIPTECPYCGHDLTIEKVVNTYSLVCKNTQCTGKLINRLTYFCGKRGLDIKGLSQKTLEDLLEWGYVNNYRDIFELRKMRTQWIKKDGYGPKSVDKVLDAIDAVAANVQLDKFISALCIPFIGPVYAQTLAAKCGTYKEFRDKVDNHFNFSTYEGFGESKTASLYKYDYKDADSVASILTFGEAPTETIAKVATFKVVVTGSLHHFHNRDELKRFVIEHGGSLIDRINPTVNYLITNNADATSGKAKEAKALGIPFLTEEEFLKKFENSKKF